MGAVAEKVTRRCRIEKVEAACGGYELKVPRIKANKGDKIRWEPPEGHAVSIWFPDSGVFYTPSIAVMHLGPVEATVRDDAKDGVYEYAIYDHAEHEFVVCESHPKVEIPIPGG
jgi:hypothetical protein